MSSRVADKPDPRAIFAPGALGVLSDNHVLDAFSPVNRGSGAAFVGDQLLNPLAAALPNYDVRTDIAMRGSFKGGDWTASSGHLCGRFMAPLFGIPATDRVVYIRFGCFQRWADARVIETIVMLDLPSLVQQAGLWPFALRSVPISWPRLPRAAGGSGHRVTGWRVLPLSRR